MTERLITCPACGTQQPASSIQAGTQSGVRQVQGAAARSAAARSTVTDATFSTEVENSATPVLLDLWADWCGPCHMLAPTIDQLSSEMAGRVKVAKLNIDENPGTANRFGVRSIPTLLVLKGGKEVDRLVGVQPKQEIVAAGERSEVVERSDCGRRTGSSIAAGTDGARTRPLADRSGPPAQLCRFLLSSALVTQEFRPLFDQRLLRSLRVRRRRARSRRPCALSSSADPIVFPST